MKNAIKVLGKVLFWTAILALGLLLGIPAAIYQAWTGERLDAAANAMSGMEG